MITEVIVKKKRINKSKINEESMTPIPINRNTGKCWKKNPNCDIETNDLVAQVKELKEKGEFRDGEN